MVGRKEMEKPYTIIAHRPLDMGTNVSEQIESARVPPSAVGIRTIIISEYGHLCNEQVQSRPMF